jgi:hypothetical protein
MIGGSRRRRHHSKPGPRLDPTRLRDGDGNAPIYSAPAQCARSPRHRARHRPVDVLMWASASDMRSAAGSGSGCCANSCGRSASCWRWSPIFCVSGGSCKAPLFGSAGSRCALADNPEAGGSAARPWAARRPRTAILLKARAAQAGEPVLLEGALPRPVLLLGQLVAPQRLTGRVPRPDAGGTGCAVPRNAAARPDRRRRERPGSAMHRRSGSG